LFFVWVCVIFIWLIATLIRKRKRKMKRQISIALAVALLAIGAAPASAGVQSEVSSWGLDRVDQKIATATLDRSYSFPDSAGVGVQVYVVDTGVLGTLPNFGGRVLTGFDALAGLRTPHQANRDCNGHGTAVAGIIASATYGVAKNATIVPVRVADCRGGVSPQALLKGLDWIAKNHPRNTPGVVNISVAVSKSKAVDDAITKLYSLGLVSVVASGNQNMDACRLSPGGATHALTVGSINMNDQRTNTSNFGECVSMFAPGGLVITEGTNGLPSTRSGTSFSAPHVAGAIALYLSSNPKADAPATVWEITRNGLSGVVADAKSVRGNVLLNTAFLNR
jgi:subtilisin family serine protease